MRLVDKLIVLGVSGSIAAYKSPDLVQRFKQLGASVQVIMTRSAVRLVAPAVFHAISGNTVIRDIFDRKENADPMPHITLGNRADLFLIAPATGNVIGKIAQGIADDAVTTTALAMRAPILMAPAMHDSMWNDPATQENVNILRGRGVEIISPELGSLAGGQVAEGRMAEIETIVAAVIKRLAPPADFKGTRVLVTAGGTREPIDPVRFLGNRSSGKMGVSLARAAFERGGEVTLVCGAVTAPLPQGVRILKAERAEEMRKVVLENAKKANVVIMAAAVADFTPFCQETKEKRKRKGSWKLDLKATQDILKDLGKLPGNRILVGFAAETENVVTNAKKKLQEKALDFIVANDITQKGAGFDSDTNIVHILSSTGGVVELPLMRKEEVAHKILDQVAARLRVH